MRLKDWSMARQRDSDERMRRSWKKTEVIVLSSAVTDCVSPFACEDCLKPRETVAAFQQASLPLSMGGLGSESADHGRQEMIRDRCFQGWGMTNPTAGFRPDMPPIPAQTWVAASRIKVHRHAICVYQGGPSLSEAERAMLRSGGPLAACPFTCVPTSRLVRFDPNRFVFCYCADCVSPSPLQQRHADVAVP